MKLISALERELQQIDRQHLRRRRHTTSSPCAPYVTVDGRVMLSFCSNDYLGLASHPQVVEAMHEGVSRYGAGSGASHMISGHSDAHAMLEEKLAAFIAPHLDSARALYFSTGYMANMGVLSALAGRDVDLFSESLNHASLIDGARLSRARIEIYPHRDTEALARMLEKSPASIKVVVTDSVFSMDGDIAPLPDLLALCEQHGAWLVVDDAHGFGVLGEHGRGALEHFRLKSAHLIYIGTLGKAAGVSGAFVAAHSAVIEWLVQRSRPYIYTTASAPALAHALLTSVDIIAGAEGAQRRAHLQNLIAQLRSRLELKRWHWTDSQTPIQPLIIGANDDAMLASAKLYEEGLWIPAIRPPTVPSNTARLRLTLSAAHTADDLGKLAAALKRLENETDPSPERVE
jgi:8-amino-7-oxononanoate synthase